MVNLNLDCMARHAGTYRFSWHFLYQTTGEDEVLLQFSYQRARHTGFLLFRFPTAILNNLDAIAIARHTLSLISYHHSRLLTLRPGAT